MERDVPSSTGLALHFGKATRVPADGDKPISDLLSLLAQTPSARAPEAHHVCRSLQHS